MMNYIWGGMIIISLIVSVFTGRVEQTAAGGCQRSRETLSLFAFHFMYNVSMDMDISKIGEEGG